MKKTQQQNRFGIWIDKKQATIIKVAPDGSKDYIKVKSHVPFMERFKGESTSKTGLFGTTLSREKNYRKNKTILSIILSKKWYPILIMQMQS